MDRTPRPLPRRASMSTMHPRTKLWLEQDDKLALSDYRLRLLKAIAEGGSLAAAAGTLDLSYRRAWGKIREIEQNLGVELVQSAAGGAGGGGSRLTPAGELLIERYEQFAIRSRDAVAAIYDEIFSPDSPTDPATLRSDRFGPM